MDDFITMTIGKQKNIALIAHDGKKAELIAWCDEKQRGIKEPFSLRNRNNGKNDYR